MMQNSLEQLFTGMAQSLRETVLPALEDSYARSQVLAAVELLGNISTRVEWRCGPLWSLVERFRPVLAAAGQLARADQPELEAARALVSAGPPDRLDNAALVAARAAHLSALAGVQAWVAQEEAAGNERVKQLHQQVRDLVVWHLDEELAQLRTGMFSSKTH